MIIRDFIIKEHRVLTESQARAQLMEDPVFRHARQFGQLLVEYNLTKAQVQQLFKDVEQGATAAGSNRTGLGKAKDYTTKTIGNIISGARKWVKERPTYQAVDAEYNRAMTALGKVGGENGEANAITKAIYKYRDAAKQYPRATGLAKWAIITAAGLATGGVGGAGVAAGLAAIDSAIKDKEIVDIVGDAAAAALVSGAVQGAADLGGQALDAYRGLPSDAAVAANNAALGGFNDSGVPGGAASNINGLDLPADAATGDGTAMGDTTPSISGGQDIGGYNPDNVPGGTYTVMKGDQGGFIAQANGVPFKDLQALNPDITNWNKLPVGTELNLPPSGDNVGSVWQGTDMSAPGVAPANTGMNPTDMNNFRADNLARMQDQADAAYYKDKPDDFGINPRSNDAVGSGMPGSAAGSTERFIPQKDGSWIDASTGKIADPAKLQASQAAVRNALGVKESVWSKVAESVKVKVLPNNQLIDSKFTVYAWALNESTNREMGRSLQLTKLGVHTIFENIGRYRRAYLKEYIGAPTADYGHPTAPGAPASATAGQGKPKGWFGRGLDTIGRGVDAVGGWASNVGHNVITKVTADKLNNMWNRAGEPYDSDRLYQLLTTEWGVPKQVVDSVYQRMNLSAATSAPAASTPAATPTGTTAPTSTGGTVTQTSTGQVHRARADNPNAAVANPATAVPTTATAPVATPGAPAAGNPAGWNDPKSANYVGRREVARRQAAQPAAASATPNFGQQAAGYAKVNQPTTMKYSGVPMAKPSAPAAAPVAKEPVVNMPADNRTNTAKAGNLNIAAQKPYVQGRAGFGANPTKFASFKPETSAMASLGQGMNNMFKQPSTVTPGDAEEIPNARPNSARFVKRDPALAPVAESLSWSRNFNPGMTLFRQMKREQS